jgi:hypothetical protein
MKQFGKYCIDCSSDAITRTIDEVKPLFRMEIVQFACGALLKSTFTANGNIGRASHSGCTGDSGL